VDARSIFTLVIMKLASRLKLS